MVNLDEALPFDPSRQRSMAKRANGNFGYGENQMQTRPQNSQFTVGGLLSCDNKRQAQPEPRGVRFPGRVIHRSNELYGHAQPVARVRSGDVGALLVTAEKEEPPRLATEATR